MEFIFIFIYWQLRVCQMLSKKGDSECFLDCYCINIEFFSDDIF